MYIGYIEVVKYIELGDVKPPIKSLWNCKWNRINREYDLDNVFTPGPGPFTLSQSDMRSLWECGQIKTIKNKEYKLSK